MSETSYHRPEDNIFTKRIRAKRRFKAIVRSVMANLEWLGEVGDEQLGENVMKNIQLLTAKRRQGKQKGLLTIVEKSILNKNNKDRTPEEKMHLAKILSGLKCFKRYPHEVKVLLTSATYYVFLRPGRVIVKQYHEAHALYFIISGTVNVIQEFLDPILGIKEDKVIGTMEVGDLFGEVSLLHDIRRTATIETLTPCELLMLRRKDFDRVLKSTVKAEWDNILDALKRFSYFDSFTDIDRRECCILSKIKEFPKDSIIVGANMGNINLVHFILKGRASMLVQLITNKKSDSCKGFLKSSIVLPYVPGNTSTMEARGPPTSEIKKAKFTSKSMQMSINDNQETTQFQSVTSKSEQVPTIRSFLSKFRKNVDSSTNIKGSGHSIQLHSDTVHIMHVAELNELACFSVGEDLSSKVIIANSDVTCLQVPYFWLMQRNISTWIQVKAFWQKVIPTPEKLFSDFIKDRKWEKYKRDLARRGTPCNYIFNIPYSIRLNDVEANMFD